ncbi:hypothetical protein SAMN05428974_0686 [Sphingopyxis sp. YR583]|uniref:hypothetical protein n=1 Tax=Sphingopyxis sp. YR583 TaxID=1881047 RepID=UPI0008A7AE52|nr:hypothetical protein [Sphingopyxis sp. YR583]SEH13174.1 hypothetical protein SAMN05428974_0686 [Sphingopyxis sp. YR583]
MSDETTQAMGGGMAAIVTGGVVLLIAGFIVLGLLLGLTPLYAGFLLLWYWGSVDMVEGKALAPLLVGACGGTATAWLLQYGAIHGGLTGVLPVLGLIVAAIYVQLRGWLPLLINRPYMLYLTVMAAPLLQAGESFVHVMAAIGAATLYFGGVVAAGRAIMARRAVASA